MSGLVKINALLIYFLAPLILSNVNCRQKREVPEDNRRVDAYQLWVSNLDTIDLRGTYKMKVKREEIDNSVIFDAVPPYFIRNDSIFFEEIFCKNIDTVQLLLKDRPITLFISDFDQEGSADEESYLFWNRDFGVVAQYNWSMGPVILFEPESAIGLSNILYKSIVNREKERYAK